MLLSCTVKICIPSISLFHRRKQTKIKFKLEQDLPSILPIIRWKIAIFLDQNVIFSKSLFMGFLNQINILLNSYWRLYCKICCLLKFASTCFFFCIKTWEFLCKTMVTCLIVGIILFIFAIGVHCFKVSSELFCRKKEKKINIFTFICA